MTHAPLNFEVIHDTIKIVGVIDRNTVTTLLTQIDLTAITQRSVIIDLADLDKIDTAGLAWILKVKSHTRATGQELTLRQPPPQLISLAELGGVHTLLNSHH